MQYHDAAPDRGLSLAMERISPGSMRYYADRLTRTTIPAISRILDYFRRNHMQVFHLTLGSEHRDLRDCPKRFRDWTRAIEERSGVHDLWWSGNPDFAILEELMPLAGETVVRKTTNGAFNGSGLDDIFRYNGISRLIITGVVTSACVALTALDAADRGYDCVLVSDALADHDEEMHMATLKSFAMNFGRVVERPEDVISVMENSAWI
ncbi:cysteine hydrolase [Mesorhizobium sp. B2-4-2]|nr:cysteine hydrolase [Mesorhizobium sp. B2-6-1]TPL49405.1 cysteine hydrolase [Mesorhizobium sp. B2-4-2]TPN17624.1 cysteine hydrolase [Mesorhizobium sp. B2-1-3]